jgi:hypothetical protein
MKKVTAFSRRKREISDYDAISTLGSAYCRGWGILLLHMRTLRIVRIVGIDAEVAARR